MQTAGENPMDDATAKEEYEKSEKSLRYQLIEAKLMEANGLKVDFRRRKRKC